MLSLDLMAERRELMAFSILRQYGWIQFLGANSGTPVAQYRFMRRQGDGEFAGIRTIAPSELQVFQFQMQDGCLGKGVPFIYQVRAFEVALKLIGISLLKTI